MTLFIRLEKLLSSSIKKVIFSIFFIFTFLHLNSQTYDSKEINKKINSFKSEKEKVDFLNTFTTKKYFKGPTDSILPLLMKALDIAQKINYEKGKFNTFINLGNNFFFIGEKDKALSAYQNALKICQRYNNKLQEAITLENIGLVYESTDNYKKALAIFLASLRIKESINYQRGIAISYDNIGIIYLNENNYPKSLTYYYKSLKIKKELKDSSSIALNFHNIAYVFECQYKYHEAIKMYLLAIKIKKKNKFKDDLAISYNNLGSCYNQINLKDSALFYHKKSFEINFETNNNRGIALSAHALAGDFFNRNELDSAKFYSKIALEKATKGSNLYIKKSIFELLSQIYKRQNQFELALKYNELSQSLNDSIYNQDSQRTIAEMSAKYEIEKKEIENKNLLSQNKINTLEINNQRIFITSLIILILVLIFVSWLIFSRKALKQKEFLKSELLNQQEIRTKAIIEAQEMERKRVAMDLHDGVGQTLAGAKMNMASMIDHTEFSSEESKNQMDLTMKLMDEAYKEVRELAHQMMPKALRDIGLDEAITDLLKKTLANTSLTYAFDKNNYKRTDESIEIVLYRVFQELLTNILKHAQATRIVVNLQITQVHVVLMVEDNGIGIKESEDSTLNGIGLTNILARISMLNGTFLITNGEKEGTIAVIRIPFSQKDLVI